MAALRQKPVKTPPTSLSSAEASDTARAMKNRYLGLGALSVLVASLAATGCAEDNDVNVNPGEVAGTAGSAGAGQSSSVGGSAAAAGSTAAGGNAAAGAPASGGSAASAGASSSSAANAGASSLAGSAAIAGATSN